MNLTLFVDLAARLYFGDHGVTAVLHRFDVVEALLDDPAQRRSGSDFEKRCLAAVRELRPIVSGMSARSLDEQDGVLDVLTSIPPWEILGECDRESRFDLVCWNEANSLAEGVQWPYLAARHIASALILAPQASLGDFHEPFDRYAVVVPMTRLAVRYEDEPAEREAIAAEIGAELDAFRARTPWPITEHGRDDDERGTGVIELR